MVHWIRLIVYNLIFSFNNYKYLLNDIVIISFNGTPLNQNKRILWNSISVIYNT